MTAKSISRYNYKQQHGFLHRWWKYVKNAVYTIYFYLQSLDKKIVIFNQNVQNPWKYDYYVSFHRLKIDTKIIAGMQTSGNSGLWKSATWLVRLKSLHFLMHSTPATFCAFSPTASYNHLIKKWTRSIKNILGASPTLQRTAAKTASA